MKLVRTLGLFLASGLMAGLPSYAQHSYTPEDLANGGRLYRANCLTCHGPGGDAITNAPLMNGKFRRGNSDEELLGIIRSGISGTTMPAQTSLSDDQIGMIVGFLRSVASTVPSAPAIANQVLPGGDALRGKEILEGKGNCLSCHVVNGSGSQFGPDLSSIGTPALGRGGRGGGRRGNGGTRGGPVPVVPSAPSAADLARLQESLLEPNANVANNNRYVSLSLKDGSTTVGKLLNQDTFAIQIFDFRERLQSVPRSSVREVVFKSPMPSYRDKLTTQELADLLGYLATLKGQIN